VLADDFKFEAAGPDFVEVLLLAVLTAEVLGFPWAWPKLRGGTEFSWVGYQHQLREHALGLSESRAAWLRGWLGSLLADKVVVVRDFVAGLGRAAYSCGALEYDRPFLAPLYTFASLHQLDSSQPLPTYVLTVLKFLQDRLLIRRMYPCAQPLEPMAEAIRVDAKAEGETATIGGWLPCRDRAGRIDVAASPWFYVELNDVVAPWAYEKDRQPFRVVASLEALAVLVAVLTLTPPRAGQQPEGYRDASIINGQPGEFLRINPVDDHEVSTLPPGHGARGGVGGPGTLAHGGVGPPGVELRGGRPNKRSFRGLLPR